MSLLDGDGDCWSPFDTMASLQSARAARQQQGRPGKRTQTSARAMARALCWVSAQETGTTLLSGAGASEKAQPSRLLLGAAQLAELLRSDLADTIPSTTRTVSTVEPATLGPICLLEILVRPLPAVPRISCAVLTGPCVSIEC